jgi:hypothetical protein
VHFGNQWQVFVDDVQNNPVSALHLVLPHVHAASFGVVPSVCVHVGENWQVFVDGVQNNPVSALHSVLPHLHAASFMSPLVNLHGDAEHWLVELSQINPVSSLHSVLPHKQVPVFAAEPSVSGQLDAATHRHLRSLEHGFLAEYSAQ